MKINLNTAKELGYDSTEELLISLYLQELKDNGYITEIVAQPTEFLLFAGEPRKFFKLKQLKTKISKRYFKKKYLINPHLYTADFKILWASEKKIPILVEDLNSLELNNDIPLKLKDDISYFEVKSSWDRNNMTRLFTSRTQPLVWEKYGIYTQLIKPLDLFKNTFIPKKAMGSMYYSKSTKKNKKGDKKFNWEYRTLTEYLK